MYRDLLFKYVNISKILCYFEIKLRGNIFFCHYRLTLKQEFVSQEVSGVLGLS